MEWASYQKSGRGKDNAEALRAQRFAEKRAGT
jgi:hypothetical protein